MRRGTIWWMCGLAVACISASAQSSVPVEPTPLSIRLMPVGRDNPSASIDTVRVAIAFETSPIPAGQPVVDIETANNNVDTSASQIDTLRGRDANGPFMLSPRAGNATDDGKSWVADRALSGHVEIGYVVAANAVKPPRGPAPPLGATNDGQGFSAGGAILLALPAGIDREFATTIDWDLSQAPIGSVGVSSLGQGHVGPMRLSRSEVQSLFFMAGRLGQWPRPSGDGFFSAWQGTPPFDAPALMRWTGQLHTRMIDFFGGTPTRYGVFLRYNPINAGGGVALFRSFVTTFGAGEGARVDKVSMTLSHEMVHTFQPRIDHPDSDWFEEGIAVFYQARLPLRFGMITPDQFIADINYYAARYYTNALKNLPEKEVTPGFWRDTRIRTLAYDRGMLFLVTLDEAIRRRSGGQRSMDDLVHAMLKANAGKPVSLVQWESLLRAELGEEGMKAYRAALAGATPLPSSSAFGPCFRRTSVRMRRYEVGFDPAVLGETRRIVRRVVAGSAAALAGLRNGDEIVVPVPQDAIQGNQQERLTLQVRRDGKTFPITYLPRGETVDSPQWQRVPGIPDAKCAI